MRCRVCKVTRRRLRMAVSGVVRIGRVRHTRSAEPCVGRSVVDEPPPPGSDPIQPYRSGAVGLFSPHRKTYGEERCRVLMRREMS